VAGINEMKRHYANYLHGLPNIKEYRNKLVVLKTVAEIDEVLEEVKTKYQHEVITNKPEIAYNAECQS
jgi:tRNA-dihydrouridine synthase